MVPLREMGPAPHRAGPALAAAVSAGPCAEGGGGGGAGGGHGAVRGPRLEDGCQVPREITNLRKFIRFPEVVNMIVFF